MKNLIDTILRFTSSGFAAEEAAGDDPGTQVKPATKPFKLYGQPAFERVKGENGEEDFIEVFVLGEEDNIYGIYQNEISISGCVSPCWYKIPAGNPTELKEATYIYITREPPRAHRQPYARFVNTGSHGLIRDTPPFVRFKITGHGSNTVYTQMPGRTGGRE